jgi:hypothetical protein
MHEFLNTLFDSLIASQTIAGALSYNSCHRGLTHIASDRLPSGVHILHLNVVWHNNASTSTSAIRPIETVLECILILG